MYRPTKAYNNPEFVNSEDARSVRILCEYLEPRMRLARHGVHRAVVFFGSARMKPQPASGPDHYAAAAGLAERLARWTLEAHAPGNRVHICTGGGPGIMQAAHEGAARVDRSLNVAFNISLPFEQAINDFVEPDLAFEFHYFFMRKFWFMNVAHAVAVFPGGYGTLDELFEMLTLTQTGKHPRMPIVLYGSEHWRRTVDFPGLVKDGLIAPEDLELFRVVDDVPSAFEWLATALA